MRTLLLAAFGMLLVACAGQIDDGGGGGDDDVPETCGNGVTDPGEECDGEATCSATCTNLPVPRLTSSLDRTTVTTELGKTELVTLTLTSVDGFAGDVGVTTSVLDAASAPLVGLVTVTGPTTVSVAAGATVPSQFTMVIPTNATGAEVTANVKFDLALATGTETISSALTVSNVYTVTYVAGTGANGATHPIQSGVQTPAVTVKRGTVIKYLNSDTVTHRTHGDGAFPHQADGLGAAGTSYDNNTIGTPPGTTGRLGCHDHGGDDGYVTFTIE